MKHLSCLTGLGRWCFQASVAHLPDSITPTGAAEPGIGMGFIAMLEGAGHRERNLGQSSLLDTDASGCNGNCPENPTYQPLEPRPLSANHVPCTQTPQVKIGSSSLLQPGYPGHRAPNMFTRGVYSMWRMMGRGRGAGASAKM